MASDLVAVENRLWATADQLWANTGLKPSEFSTPVLGLIFLRHADKRFTQAEAALAAKGIRDLAELLCHGFLRVEGIGKATRDAVNVEGWNQPAMS